MSVYPDALGASHILYANTCLNQDKAGFGDSLRWLDSKQLANFREKEEKRGERVDSFLTTGGYWGGFVFLGAGDVSVVLPEKLPVDGFDGSQ